jgi:hypothetical protein
MWLNGPVAGVSTRRLSSSTDSGTVVMALTDSHPGCTRTGRAQLGVAAAAGWSALHPGLVRAGRAAAYSKVGDGEPQRTVDRMNAMFAVANYRHLVEGDCVSTHADELALDYVAQCALSVANSPFISTYTWTSVPPRGTSARQRR